MQKRQDTGKMKKEIISLSPEETFDLARSIGSGLKRGTVIAITGDLGAGKTLFAKGIALGMGIEDDVTSPSFSIMESYDSEIPLYHFDLYRIEYPDELDNLFFEEYWEGDGVSVIEWAENAGDRLPDRTIKISMQYSDEKTRRIIIEYPDN